MFLHIAAVRRFYIILAVLSFAWLAQAETFKLANGKSVTGELLAASANDAGVQIKLGEGEYERVPWANFTQEDLKRFAQDKKLEPLVEPFIEITQEERIKKTEVNIKQPPRIERPAAKSLFGALFSSGLGLLVVLLLYAANIYAAYEISIFRAQPTGLVCGIAAVAPVIGPIIFLSMPTKIQPTEQTWETAEAAAAAASTAEVVNPMLDSAVQHPAGLKLADTKPEAAKQEQAAPTVYQRGQTTFNRRFFETKFPGLFGVVRRDHEKDMVLVIKSSRGQFAGQRITRIAANDLHLEVQKGHASEEVMIPFMEIQEVRFQHRDVS